MRVTTIDEARQLVGRTFERDGVVKSIDALGEWLYEFRIQIDGKWYRSNGTVSEMAHWLSGATEITAP